MSTVVASQSAIPALEQPRTSSALAESELGSYPPATATTSHDDSAPAPAPLDQNTRTLTPAMRLRVSLWRRLTSDSQRLQAVAFWLTVKAAQIIAWSVILALTYHDDCDQPFQAFLVITSVRLALSMPVTLYNAFVPRKPSRRDTQEIIAERERRRRFGSPALDARVRSLQSLLFFADVVLFLLGNWWYFSSETCSATAPTLYKSALAALILSWLGLAEFVLTVLAILVCLPLVLLFFRASGIRPGQNEVGPLDEKEINKLPRKIFLGILEEQSTSATATTSGATALGTSQVGSARESAPSSPGPASSSAPSRSRQWWRLWRTGRGARRQTSKRTDKNANAKLPAGVAGIRLPESQSSCSICLCDYEPPNDDAASQPDELETLIQLPACSHAFHESCLESWLKVSGRCPLCQVPVIKQAAAAANGARRRAGSGSGNGAAAGPSADSIV